MLPISNIEFLSISASDTIQSVNWYELARHCQNVTLVQAIGHGTSGLLRSLAPPKPTKATPTGKFRKRGHDKTTQAQASYSTTSAHAPITPFPNLTSLLGNLNSDFVVSQYGILYYVVAYVLRRRNANNIPLKMLRIDHCIIGADRAKGLKEHALVFHWDGDEHPELEEWADRSDFTDPGIQLGNFFFDTVQADWE